MRTARDYVWSSWITQCKSESGDMAISSFLRSDIPYKAVLFSPLVYSVLEYSISWSPLLPHFYPISALDSLMDRSRSITSFTIPYHTTLSYITCIFGHGRAFFFKNSSTTSNIQGKSGTARIGLLKVHFSCTRDLHLYYKQHQCVLCTLLQDIVPG